MRDVIWTVIVIWLIYKLVDFFKNSSAKKSYNYHSQTNTQTNNYSTPSNKKDAIRKGADNEGEYVDYEEIK